MVFVICGLWLLRAGSSPASVRPGVFTDIMNGMRHVVMVSMMALGVEVPEGTAVIKTWRAQHVTAGGTRECYRAMGLAKVR
mmetsp:Transcript_6709/g.12091  ORF Transcript_6709/g.12091 Transcript_6709/m.12091 type:complete len:81 (-) Transcript_6709:111-353(-)